MQTKLYSLLRGTLIIATALIVASVVAHAIFADRISDWLGSESEIALEEAKPVDVSATLREMGETCESFPISLSEKVAVLRIDDIPAFTWAETSKHMINTAVDRDIPLSLGVIPINLTDDTDIVATLLKHECNLEIAQHGFTHEQATDGVSGEFALLSEAEATDRLAQGLLLLQQTFNSPIETWIPPQNQQSAGTLRAVESLEFVRTSADGDGQFDYDASSFNYTTSELFEVTQVVESCEQEVSQSGVCIIMLHPQEYATDMDHDPELFENYYVALLDALVEEGYTFARFKDLEGVQ